ncbi:MAG: metallophosphoesterase [Tannerella sp.]|nr:metallophosphoesterase [Tannerella sp.]
MKTNRMKTTCFIFAVLLLSTACENRTTLTVAHLCDPQLGFGADGFAADSARFEQEIRQVNELAPDLVVIAGDMVNDIREEHAVSTIVKLMAKIRPPVILTPGNHDLPDPVTAEGLARYRAVFGNDFSYIQCKGRAIISANSQLWREAPEEEKEAHRQKLHRTLQQAKKKKLPVILLTHVPPFVVSADEKEEYFNLPLDVRKELLDLAAECGVVVWLSGHTHTTLQRTHAPFAILNGETTSVNFDNHPAGFRLLTVYPDRHFDWVFNALQDGETVDAGEETRQ